MTSNIFIKKKELRKNQLKKRKELFLKIKNQFNKNLFDELFDILNFPNINVISSFISINSEINTFELNKYILKQGKVLCLPVILKKNSHLLFRKFTQNLKLIEGFMKIKEPPINSDILIPELLFVPCLAYDKLGYRLGYGGGYYDKTFSYLNKKKKTFISVGYAFDEQKVDELPKDKFDIKLDYVITEKKLHSFI